MSYCLRDPLGDSQGIPAQSPAIASPRATLGTRPQPSSTATRLRPQPYGAICHPRPKLPLVRRCHGDLGGPVPPERGLSQTAALRQIRHALPLNPFNLTIIPDEYCPAPARLGASALPPGAPVGDRLTTNDDRTRLLLSNRFAGMDVQSRLQAGAPNGGWFRGTVRMRPLKQNHAI